MQIGTKTKQQTKRLSRNRAQWLEDVIEWRSSGKSAAEFASHRGLHPKTLALWGSRLRHEVPRRGMAPKKGAAGFLPVRVTGSRVGMAAASPGSVRVSGEFEVTLSNGRRVRVLSAFEPEVLIRLLDAVEGNSRC